MLKYLFFLIIFFACTSLPVEKELLYKGEPLNEIGPYGVLIGHTMVPFGDFPYDRRSAVLYFENVKTKQEYHYGETRGSFFMKLPAGEYAVKDIWSDGKCNPTTGLMISSFFSELPDSVSHLKRAIEKPAGSTLGFKIAQGKMTDIGNILMTCLEWNGNEKFKNQFTSFIRNGKFQIFMPVNTDSQDCGCKLLRKKDGVSLREYKKAIGKN